MARSAVLERSYGSVKTFWLDNEYICRNIRKAVTALQSDTNVARVILFGSFASGRAVPGSDIDILIILTQDSRRFVDRVHAYMDLFADLGISVDLFPVTVNELESNPVARTALSTGKVLFERNNPSPESSH